MKYCSVDDDVIHVIIMVKWNWHVIRDCTKSIAKKYNAITQILDIAQYCNTPRQMRIKKRGYFS